jgi:hypothetical protein
MVWFLLSSLVPLALGLTALAAVVLGDYAQAQVLRRGSRAFCPRTYTIRSST